MKEALGPGRPPPVGADMEADVKALAALRALSLAADRFRQAVAAHYGLSVSDTLALSHLSDAGEMTAGQLARHLGLTSGSITALLDRMDVAGMIERRRHPADRRKTIVGLTARGEGALVTVRRWMRDALVGLDDGELKQTATVLSDVAVRLNWQTEMIASGPSNLPG